MLKSITVDMESKNPLGNTNRSVYLDFNCFVFGNKRVTYCPSGLVLHN